MTLLITALAAAATTIVWYATAHKSPMKVGILALMYWGATLMWLVDAVVEYIELGAEYFQPAGEDMLNDAFLGFTVIALGLVIWLGIVFIRDPKGVVRKALKGKA